MDSVPPPSPIQRTVCPSSSTGARACAKGAWPNDGTDTTSSGAPLAAVDGSSEVDQTGATLSRCQSHLIRIPPCSATGSRPWANSGKSATVTSTPASPSSPAMVSAPAPEPSTVAVSGRALTRSLPPSPAQPSAFGGSLRARGSAAASLRSLLLPPWTPSLSCSALRLRRIAESQGVRSGLAPLVAATPLDPGDGLPHLLHLCGRVLRIVSPEHQDHPPHAGVGHLLKPAREVLRGSGHRERVYHLVGDQASRVGVARPDRFSKGLHSLWVQTEHRDQALRVLPPGHDGAAGPEMVHCRPHVIAHLDLEHQDQLAFHRAPASPLRPHPDPVETEIDVALGQPVGDDAVRDLAGKLEHLGAARGPKMLELAGEVADGVITHGLAQSYVDFCLDRIRMGAERAGRSPVECELVLMFEVEMRDDMRAAVDHLRPRCTIMAGGEYAESLIPVFGLDPEAVKPLREAVRARDPDAGRLVTDEMVHAFAVAGPPEHLASRLQEMADAGVGRVILVFRGDNPEDTAAKMEQVGKAIAGVQGGSSNERSEAAADPLALSDPPKAEG